MPEHSEGSFIHPITIHLPDVINLVLSEIFSNDNGWKERLLIICNRDGPNWTFILGARAEEDLEL